MMDDKHLDELIRKALQEDMELPEGLGERLEQTIDRLAAGSAPSGKATLPRRSILRHPLLRWTAGVAAALLAAGLFLFTERQDTDRLLTDTFSDPREAALAADQALALLSRNLNKGLGQVSEAGEGIANTRKILQDDLKISLP